MKSGPTTPDEAAHMLGLRYALRLDAWPDEDTEDRVVEWMRLYGAARMRRRRSDDEAKRWRRAHGKERDAEESPPD